MFSRRINNIGESKTAIIAAKAIQMKKDNINVVDLTIGEPDFPTPQNISTSAIEAINNNITKYTLIRGTSELRKAIAIKFKNDNDLEYDPDNIIVSNGAKQSIFNIMLTLIDKDDEVIIPAPYWVSYPEIVAIAEGKSVIIPTHEKSGFKITTQQLKDAISDRTRVLILCNPSNPTGALYTRTELTALAQLIEDKDIIVISDEIYEKLIYDKRDFCSFASVSPDMKYKSVIINGFSKAYAMTGWRLGYAAGPKDIIESANKIQSHSTTNASSISQYAGVEALLGSQNEINKMRDEFEKRRNFVYRKLSQMKDLECLKPEGAFYIFPNISSFFSRSYNGHTINNSNNMALYLLEEAKILLMPGAAFGSDNHLRISFAASMEILEEGMRRMAEAFSNLESV